MLREIIYQNIILYHQKGCKSLIKKQINKLTDIFPRVLQISSKKIHIITEAVRLLVAEMPGLHAFLQFPISITAKTVYFVTNCTEQLLYRFFLYPQTIKTKGLMFKIMQLATNQGQVYKCFTI